MKVITHDEESVSLKLNRDEYLCLVELVHFISVQYESLDAIQLDISKTDIKTLSSNLEEATPRWG